MSQRRPFNPLERPLWKALESLKATNRKNVISYIAFCVHVGNSASKIIKDANYNKEALKFLKDFKPYLHSKRFWFEITLLISIMFRDLGTT